MKVKVKIYGLIGNPLGHSFSKKFFTEKFEKEKINAVYKNFELKNLDQLNNVLDENSEIKGFNVTIPYKEQIISKLDNLDSTAKKIGAVNTVRVSLDPKQKKILTGYNTDIIGFTESIRPFIKPYHRRALILGTGGASKAIAAGLNDLGISYQFVSRSRGENRITYSDLNESIIAAHTVIVNTTPLGMWPDTETCPDLPYMAITAKHVCFDAVYNPFPTLFLRLCEERGARIIGGLEMLHLQALASWKIWNND